MPGYSVTDAIRYLRGKCHAIQIGSVEPPWQSARGGYDGDRDGVSARSQVSAGRDGKTLPNLIVLTAAVGRRIADLEGRL